MPKNWVRYKLKDWNFSFMFELHELKSYIRQTQRDKITN